jgi:hypothetical protein
MLKGQENAQFAFHRRTAAMMQTSSPKLDYNPKRNADGHALP